MPTLDVISVNLWQMVVSLINLVLLFLIMKRFLYRPVKKMLQERQNTIDSDYSAAQKAKEQALADQKKYEEKLQAAYWEADQVVKTAAAVAGQREEQILLQAKKQADDILLKAQEDAALERKKSEALIRHEIAEVSSLLTEKLLEREISSTDHQRFIDSFIESIGDQDDTN